MRLALPLRFELFFIFHSLKIIQRLKDSQENSSLIKPEFFPNEEVFTEGLGKGALGFVRDPFNDPEGAVINRARNYSRCKSREVFMGVLTSPLKRKWPY